MENFRWESMTRQIWIHLSKSSKIIFDIGANTGIYSILSKVYNPSTKVSAFEPQPNVYKILKKNNHINNFNISCENIAISNKAGNFPFFNYGSKTFSNRNTTAGSLNKNWRTKNQHSIMVPVQTLRNYIEDNKISNIDLIKIDVETFEVEVLDGFSEYIRMYEPIIILEIQNESIGIKIKSIMNITHYSFFNIDEKRGVKVVQKLGVEKENKNFLLCPNSKLEMVNNFIFEN